MADFQFLDEQDGIARIQTADGSIVPVAVDALGSSSPLYQSLADKKKAALEKQLSQNEGLFGQRSVSIGGGPAESAVTDQLIADEAASRAQGEVQSAIERASRDAKREAILDRERVAMGAAPTVLQPPAGLSTPIVPTGSVVPDRIPAAGLPTETAAAKPSQPSMADPLSALKSSYGMMERGIRLQEDAQIKAAQATQKANEDFLTAYEERAKTFEVQRNDLLADTKKIQDEIIGQKVDPGRFWSSRSDGQKASLWVGAILTGLGGGDPEPMLTKLVDRDIEAQKAELGKKENLLQRNLQRLGQLDQAEAATRLQMNAILQAKIQVAAGQAGTQLAKAEAAKSIGVLRAEQSKQMQEVAKLQTGQLLARAAFSGIPAKSEPMIYASMTEEQRKAWGERRVQVGDNILQANDPKDAQIVREEMALIGPAIEGINKIKRIVDSTLAGRTLSPEDRAAVATELTFLKGQVAKINLGGVASDQEGEDIKDALGNPNNLFSVGVMKKLSTAIEVLNRKKDATLRGRVMGYDPIPERPGTR